jgi:hypothetical protein
MTVRTQRNLIAALFTAFFLLMFTAAHALEWHSANSITLGWDNTNTDLTDVSYEVFRTKHNHTDTLSLGLTNATEMVVTLPEGKWLLGVASVRIVDGQEVARSEVAWSDDPLYADPTFGVQFFKGPAAPKGLRVR